MFKLGSPKQIAYAVPDAFEAAQRWSKDLAPAHFYCRAYSGNGRNLPWVSIFV